MVPVVFPSRVRLAIAAEWWCRVVWVSSAEYSRRMAMGAAPQCFLVPLDHEAHV